MATVIAAGNIKLNMDGSGVYAEAKRVKAEMAAMRRVVKELEPAMDAYAKKEALLAQAYKAGEINARQLADRMVALREKYGVVNEGQTKAIESANRLAEAKRQLEQRTRAEAAAAAEAARIHAQAQAQRTERLATSANAHSQYESVVGQSTAINTDPTVRDVASVLKETTSRTELLRAKKEALTSALRTSGMSLKEYNDRLKILNSTYRDTNTAGSRLLSQFSGLAAGAFSVYAVFNQLKDSVKLAVDIEKNTVAFQTLTQSAGKGEALSQAIRQTALDLRLQGSALADNAKTMLQFGGSADAVVPSLIQMANITAGDVERMKMLTLARAQATAAGRLMGQDLLQMVNAGFNPLQEVSKRTGVSIIDLKKRMEEGGISIKLVDMAFASATEKGGMFHNMLENQKNTVAGQFRELNAQLELAKTQLGNDLIPLMQQLMGVTKDFMSLGSGGQKGRGIISQVLIGQAAELAALRDVISGLSSGKFDWKNWNSLANRGIQKNHAIPEDVVMGRKREKDAKMLEELELGRMKKFQEEKDKLQQKIDEAGLGKAEAERLAAIRDGFTADQADQLKAMHEEIERRKEQVEQLKSETKHTEKLASERKRLMEQGEAITKRFGTPVQKVAEEMKDLMKLLSVGAIDQKTYDKAIKEAASGAMKDRPETFAQSAAYGSNEAYKLMAGSNDKQQEVLERQEIIQQAQLQVQKDTMESIKQLNPIGAYR